MNALARVGHVKRSTAFSLFHNPLLHGMTPHLHFISAWHDQCLFVMCFAVGVREQN